MAITNLFFTRAQQVSMATARCTSSKAHHIPNRDEEMFNIHAALHMHIVNHHHGTLHLHVMALIIISIHTFNFGIGVAFHNPTAAHHAHRCTISWWPIPTKLILWVLSNFCAILTGAHPAVTQGSNFRN